MIEQQQVVFRPGREANPVFHFFRAVRAVFGVARRLAGEADLQRYEALFSRSGWWLVALSRWMPLLPEVIACLAGMSRMKARTFFLSLACGSLPLGFVYAAIGAAGQDRPTLALALSAIVPGLLILVGKRWLTPVQTDR